MKGISHEQAVKLIHLRLDGLLKESQHLSLNAHLDSCDFCREYAIEMNALPARLQNEFQVRWDRNAGPSHRVLEHVATRAKRIPMTNRISSSIRLMASGFLVAFLILGINYVILQMKSTPIDTIGTQSVSGSELINNRLIAFTSEKDGNFDIYTMSADGSNLTNLTNNPAQDIHPVWSPDGKHIVFESDRAGTKQIYLMNSDGSNIVQLTHDKVDHQLPVTDDSRHSIWSSDGNRILFLQNDPDGKTWTLNSIHINSENKTALISDTRQFATASWSPNGDYIGLLLFDELEPDRLLPNIYVIDANGSNLREINKFLPQEEHIFVPYVWSSDGQSLIFPAQKLDPYSQRIYELRLSDNALTTVTAINAMLFDWYDGIALITDFNIQSHPLVWLRPDGISTTLDYLKGANPADCYMDKERSLSGNLAIGSYCKQDEKVMFYWTNADGSTIQELPDLEVPVVNGGLTGLTLSPDEKFVTFYFESNDETNLYIWNMEGALNDSSVQPIKIVIGKGELHYFPSWQPVVNNDILEEEQAQTNNRLIAFTSKQDENFDIYTMRADGSGLINITNNPASDAYPFWSPDGKQIAFISDRDRSRQIYLMDADGSNVIQLTNGKGNYWLDPNGYTPWSPDGKKIIFFHKSPGEQNYKLYAMDIMDKNTRTLTNEPGQYFLPSWSSDGRYIAFISENDQSPRDIFVVGSDGNSLTKLTENLLPGDFFQFDYDWSKDGTSIFFTTSYTAYEANVDGSVSVITETNRPMIDWWNGTALLDDLNQGLLSWLRPDGSQSTLELCHKDDQLLNTALKRSDRGNLAFGANCSASGWTLYWTNSDGTITNKLLDSPISQHYDGLSSMTWSPDDYFIAFVGLDTNSPDVTETLYVLDVASAREAPSIQPIEMTNSFGPSWQPVVNNDILEEEQTQPDNRLIVFTSDQGGNAEIYTMYSDGSDLTNITNYSAHDVNPVWSPDGKRIAFESDRTGYIQIYTMNADGSDLIQITDGEADHAIGTQYGNTPEPWSPHGKKIIFSQTVRGDENNMLYVMDVDGSNTIALTDKPGLYTFLGWSPDGQKIVYQISNVSDNGDTRIMVASIDGTSTSDGPFFEGDGGRNHHQIHWETSEQFITLSSNSERPTWGLWNLTRFYTTEDDYLNYIGSNPILVTSDSPIVAIFDRTYVVENQDSLSWFVYSGAPIPLAPWSFSDLCKTPTDPLVAETFHTISPDKQQDFVSLHCPEGTIYFFLMNSDGTAIQQLDASIARQSQVNALTWSPDGKHVIVTTSTDSSTNSTNLFRFDVQEMLNDPSVKPIQLTTDDAWKYGVVWQPMISNEVTEKESTPEPTQISSADSLITFTADNNDAANINTDIYTIRLDGSNLTNLTHDPTEDFNANDYNPAWSPDRKKIAFMSDHRGSTTGNTNIFVMNPDGNGLSQLTYNPGYDAFLSWSPDGQRIVYFSSPIAESNVQGQLIVMNADGSDKTFLTTLGYYYFRSWSPDSEKIVYAKPRVDGASYTDAGIYVVSIDGKSQHEWFIDNIHQIHWQDSAHFLGVVQTGEATQATWSLYQFNTDGSQIELTSHNGPIVAIFERSYVVEGQDGLTWFALEGVPLSSSPWNVAEKCETTSGSYVSTNLSISPDQKRALVTIYCEDATWHYLVNEDGSEINQLGAPIDGSVAILPHWSPDGQYVSLFVIDYGDDLYLIDIQKMLNDPSATPILLATNVLAGVVYGEPLIASNDNEEKQTPEPPVFSLSVYEAELLAFFDVLEPSYLPAGYTLEGVAYNPWTQQVAMKHISQQGNASIHIYQRRGDLLHDPDVSRYVTPVPVVDREGEYIQGAWIYESPDTTIPAWDPRADSYSLTWQNGEFVFSINFVGGETITPLSLNELVAIAESLK